LNPSPSIFLGEYCPPRHGARYFGPGADVTEMAIASV
jgi:hypothetical protein